MYRDIIAHISFFSLFSGVIIDFIRRSGGKISLDTKVGQTRFSYFSQWSKHIASLKIVNTPLVVQIYCSNILLYIVQIYCSLSLLHCVDRWCMMFSKLGEKSVPEVYETFEWSL